MKIKYKISISSLLLVLISTIVIGQNNYKFIKPNISISYDSNKIKITERYSNTFYETEAYDFKPLTDKANNINIHIKAQHPQSKVLTFKEQEEMMQKEIDKTKNVINDSISYLEYDKKVRNVNGFLCSGFILINKKSNKTVASIICNHVTDSDFTGVKLISFNRQSLKRDYEILENFLKGFKAYSKKSIETEDSTIKSNYTIKINYTSNTIENLNWRKNSNFAIISTNEKLKHKIKEFRLSISEVGDAKEIFPANDKGDIYIAFSDKNKGSIERKGELIILNSFGKNVKIPFSFKYNNK